MSLKRLLETPPITQPARARHSHPKGWEPGVRFDPAGAQFVTTDALPTLEGEPNWREAVEQMGVTIPDGYRVRISEMRFDPAAWTRDSDDQKYAVTRPVWRYRFIIEPDILAPAVDGLEIINKLKRSPKPKTVASGAGAFIVNLNDTQTGKTDGGGTYALLERLDRIFDLAQQRAKEVRKATGELVLLLGGDLVEGCFIYPNQSFSGIDLDRRAQIRTTTGIVLDFLDRLAPEFPKVRVLAVGGNHGEHRINGKRVNRHDNDDQLVAEAAAMATERDNRLEHVAFTIATDQAALTMDVQGHILALTHGSVYGRMKGSEPTEKAFGWFKNMAAARHPVGDADILVGNHFHHDIVRNFGNLLFVQNPALDGGSPQFAETYGSDCAAGMSTWVMTENSRFTGYEVLR